tara:strand:+ start:24957 stop:25166 length:210 start_codon:yes stop_codon:yes gene_type:complete
MAGLNYGNTYKFRSGASNYQKNGVHYIAEANFWVMRHLIDSSYRTLKGKFKTKEEAETEYKKWLLNKNN